MSLYCANCGSVVSSDQYDCYECKTVLTSGNIVTDFNNNIKNVRAVDIYDSYKTQLAKKDGFVHILMVNSFSKWINQIFSIENKYTEQIDTIVTCLQRDGYEIVDIKFSTEQNQGLFKNMEGFYTMIMYK